MDKTWLVAIPIADGRVSMRDLRDLVEATEDAAEEDFVTVEAGEPRWSRAR